MNNAPQHPHVPAFSFTWHRAATRSCLEMSFDILFCVTSSPKPKGNKCTMM